MKSSHSLPVAVLSSDRKTETLYRTVRSLKNAGFYEIYIYYDRDRSGVWPGYQKIIRNVLHMFGTKEPILIVEDDILACRDLHEYIGRELVHRAAGDVGLISLYLSNWTRKQLFPECTERLLESTRYMDICGALAWLWNPQVLLELAMAGDIERNDLLGTDIYIPEWLLRHGYRLLNHQPSLIEHADEGCSTYENKQEKSSRHSDTFIGEETSILEYLKTGDDL